MKRLALRLLVVWREWRVRRKMRQIKRCCTWIENYARNHKVNRQERKRLFNQYGKMVFGLTTAMGIVGSQIDEENIK